MKSTEGMTFHSAEREVERLEERLATIEAEAATLRRQLAEVPRDDIAQLYDAYAYAVAGTDNAEQFPAVGRWLGVL